MSVQQNSAGETPEAHDRIKEAVQLTREEKYSEAIGLFESCLLDFGQDDRVAASAFSFYGLCVAMVRRRYAEAVTYCNMSLETGFLDPDHRYNLALVHLERNDRKKAVETLNAGLRVAPDNTKINVFFDSIGRRKPPPLSFLRRDNPINIWIGRLRSLGPKAEQG